MSAAPLTAYIASFTQCFDPFQSEARGAKKKLAERGEAFNKALCSATARLAVNNALLACSKVSLHSKIAC